MTYWKDRRVLITGGAGFIGRNLTMRLLSQGSRVRIVDNFSRIQSDSVKDYPKNAQFLSKNLINYEESLEACQSMEVVFHLASRVGPSSYYRQHPFEVMSNNLIIDTQVLRAALESGVQRYFYPSSVFVYPAERQSSPDAPPLREEEAIPSNPPLSYGWAKIIGEKMVEAAVSEGHGFRAAVERLIGVYGPGQDIDLQRGGIIPVLLRRAYEYPQQQPFSIMGNGLETRSFCYIDDIIDAMLRAVEMLDKGSMVGPINIGSEGRIRILDLAHEVVSVLGKHIEIVCLPGEPSVWGQAVDCSKARILLGGWTPKVSLRHGLELTYEDVKARLAR